MMKNFITVDSECFKLNSNEYVNQLSFAGSRIRQDKKIELDMMQEYSGRELYEMIQNADDEGSQKVELQLGDDKVFHIKNWGDRPFTEGGMYSIMRSFSSVKTGSEYSNSAVKPIGNKGLGFRSLLNWGDEITIHSNGVKCSFSENIAKNKWDELWNGSVCDERKLFEDERQGRVPLAILSIPMVSRDDITVSKGEAANEGGNGDRCTTDIEVRCKQGVVKDIADKMQGLPCAVLLFLRSVKEIVIKNSGESTRTIKKVDEEEVCSDIRFVRISDNGMETEFVVCYKMADDRSYEVAVAYQKSRNDVFPVLYSYFPTKVSMGVPAIYHGTFELDASRNYLVDSDKNRMVMHELGAVAVRLSGYLAENDLLEDGGEWEPFKMLDLRKAGISVSGILPLAESIKDAIVNGEVEIFPTVGKGFTTCDNALWLGSEIARWLKDNIALLGQKNALCNHLICYENDSEGCLSDVIVAKELTVVKDDIEEIAKSKMDVSVRATFIKSLVECAHLNRVECAPCDVNLSVLVDAEGDVIQADSENPVYLLSMKGNSPLPKCLNIHSADSYLVKELQNIWGFDIRGVTNILKAITSVRDGDRTAIRRKIETWSRKDMNYAGMCEVLRWEFQNQTPDLTPFSSDLYLINKEDEMMNASSLLLREDGSDDGLLGKIADKWWLINDLSEWVSILKAPTSEDASDFLHNILGVSWRVPLENRFFGDEGDYLDAVRDMNNKTQIRNECCNRFDTGNTVSKQYNYIYVPYKEFFNPFTLTEALGLIMEDERVCRHLLNNNINLFYSSVKVETVKYSYSAYCLRKYDKFAPLQNAIIRSSLFGGGVDYNFLENALLIDRTRIEAVLVALGAHFDIANLPVAQLYSMLAEKIEDNGVQKRYKELREAIKSKKADDAELKEARTEAGFNYVWARKNGKLDWYPIENVYYWDNDQLPQAILSDLPKLEIGSRVGEESVASIFGVNLAKKIVVSFVSLEKNGGLADDVRRYLTERLKYILAYRIGDDMKNESLIKQSMAVIRNLTGNLQIYCSASYTIDGGTSSNPDVLYDMQEGDVLVTKEKDSVQYHILCSKYSDSAAAMRDPVFCEGIKEILCMALKVTSNTMSNYFRNIITSDIQYLEYIVKKDIAPEVWAQTLKSLGLSDVDVRFWKAYKELVPSGLDVSELSRYVLDSEKYVEQINGFYANLKLPVDFTGIADMKPCELYEFVESMEDSVRSQMIKELGGLEGFYLEFFSNYRNGCFEQYKSVLYQKCAGSIKNGVDALDCIKEYQDKCRGFSEPFYADCAAKIAHEFKSRDELQDIIAKLISDKFDVLVGKLPAASVCPIGILPGYREILDKYNLSVGSVDQEILLIAKFEGLEGLFEEKIASLCKADTVAARGVPEGTPKAEIRYPQNWHSVLKSVVVSDGNDGRKRGKSSGGYVSDKEKYRLGEKAEFATFEAMCDNGDYECVFARSQILNKESGDDSLHYDISYRKKGSLETRYLEVKAMTGNSFIMSCNEYEFARKNSERYDIAIYHEGVVNIIESPFSNKEGKGWIVSPDSYKITIAKK